MRLIRSTGKRWQKQQEVQSLKERSKQEDQTKHLERELEIARQERDIPKKAVACLGQNRRP